MPADIPPAAAVDLHHTGPFQEDGRIRGTVAGSTIELALQLPWSASPVTGTLGDDPVEVAWDLSTGGKGPATLQGTVGAQAVSVRGVFRRNRDFSFLDGTISGTLADASLAASIRPVLGGFSTSGTIVANGTLGDDRFEIFGSRDVERGMVRGTYNDRSVHLDLTAEDRVAEVQRLRALGAYEERSVTVEEGWTWTVMTDPDGNEFCVTDA